MKSLIRPQLLVVAALGLAAIGTASAAHARSDVYFSIGVQAPAYVEPAPVYVNPRPVYVPPPVVYSQPAEVYVRPAAPVYYGYDNEREWRREEWRHRYWRHHHREWERSYRDWD